MVVAVRKRISPHYLRSLKTITAMDPWELKYEDDKVRYWLGGYFDGHNWIENAVTVERKYDGKWVQVDQYSPEEERIG